jgi:integrase
VTAISSAIVNAAQAALEAPSQGARETVSPRVRTSGPGRPPLIDTPAVPMSPQWSSVWRRFERSHYSQSSSTIRNRRISVTQLARWLALPENDAITDPEQVSRHHLREYMALQESVREGCGVLTTCADLHVFWRWYTGEYRDCEECADPSTYRFHSCGRSPMHGVRRPSPRKNKAKVVPVLSPSQLDDVLASVVGRSFYALRDRALIMVLVESGVRRTEAASLNVSDLDLTRRGGGTVHVRDGKNQDGSEWDGPLFTKNNGKGLTPQTIGAIVARVGKAAGLELADGRKMAPHQMRHTWADAHYRAGTSEAAMRQLGGWSGSIPQTYGQDAASERAISIGLQSPVLGLIQSRGKKG